MEEIRIPCCHANTYSFIGETLHRAHSDDGRNLGMSFYKTSSGDLVITHDYSKDNPGALKVIKATDLERWHKNPERSWLSGKITRTLLDYVYGVASPMWCHRDAIVIALKKLGYDYEIKL